MPVDVSVLQDTPQMTAPSPCHVLVIVAKRVCVFLENVTASEDVRDRTAGPWTRDSARTTATSEVFAVWVSAFVSLDMRENPAKRSHRVPRVVLIICLVVERTVCAISVVAFAVLPFRVPLASPRILVRSLRTDVSVEETVCVTTVNVTVRRGGTLCFSNITHSFSV